MGPIQLVKDLFEACCRLLCLAILMAYALWLRLWFSVQPLLQPLIDIYLSIRHTDVTVLFVTKHVIKSAMLIGVLQWQATWALLQTMVLQPFHRQVTWFLQLLHDVESKHHIVSPRSVLPRQPPSPARPANTEDDGKVPDSPVAT